jgi:hypothetical protein
MPEGDTVAQLAVVVLLLILAVPTLATAHDYAGTPFEHTETTTVDYSDSYGVQQNATDAERYGESVTVVVDGAELNDSAYEWDATSGTVSWSNTSATTDGDPASITYHAYQRTAETQLAWTIVAPFMAFFGLFAFVTAVRVLWGHIAEVWTL